MPNLMPKTYDPVFEVVYTSLSFSCFVGGLLSKRIGVTTSVSRYMLPLVY